jgi:hypothetical protein
MRTRSKLLFAALTATAFMAVAVSSASARRIELSNQRYVATWPGLEFEVPAAGVLIKCPVTLEGSFHSRTLSKVSGQLIGYVTSAKVAGSRPPCTGGTATILTETLPWHVRYDSFSGVLPTITLIRIQLVGANFRIDPDGATNPCLARTSAANPAYGNVVVGTGGRVEILRADEASNIPLTEEFFCAISGGSTFRGNSEVFLQGTTTRIFVRLVL